MLEPGIQWRRDRLPPIPVRGVVPDGVQSRDVAKQVYAEPLRAGLTADYRIELQGAVEESAKGQTSINENMPVIFGHSSVADGQAPTIRQDARGAPLGVIGASTTLRVFHAGHDEFTAIVESAVRRFRPIALTAGAAVLAVIPLTREPFWAPMALAIWAG